MHGTRTRYNRSRCRCRPCRGANASYARARAARARLPLRLRRLLGEVWSVREWDGRDGAELYRGDGLMARAIWTEALEAVLVPEVVRDQVRKLSTLPV